MSKIPSKTLFEKIIDREIPGHFVHEDEHCVAIRDINPAAPLHLLVIPRKPIPKLSDASPADQALLGHLMLTAARLAADAGYGDGFKLLVNTGAKGGQTVFHLHLHVIGGPIARMPG